MPRDWEDWYRRGETPWEKGQAAPPLVELMERNGADLWQGGPVLVPGCGFGHDVRAIAATGASVIGLDSAPSAIQGAQAFPSETGEVYELGDFLDPEWQQGRRFRALWEHTCFCAIDPPFRDAYAAAAAAVLVPGGLLAGVFYLNPPDPGDGTDGPPFPSSIDEITQRFSTHFEFLEGWVPRSAYPGREGREWIGCFRRMG
ncbi:MAG: methyltransferase domain-containing protein [Verrucomicrobia bacterium]|nr:methyltransferase domain-containing protein [Verrucomicrobiota bacterium]